MTIGVIPARGGSKGLPGKNIRPLDGEPLIVHTIRAAHAAARLDDVVVSTDDPEIAGVAQAAGVNVPRLRPDALATDEIGVWPAIRDAVADWEARSRRGADTVVLLQPTSPLRTAEDIDRCIERFHATGAEICASVCRSHDSPYVNMVEPDGASAFVRPCSPSMTRTQRRQDAPPVYAVNGAIYVVSRSVLAHVENQFMIERYAAYEMPRERSVDIDAQQDFALAEWLLERRRS